MSSGSPESATQRNGPFPSQNSGRMYSGTKPGISKASVDARRQRLAAQVVAVVEGDRAALLQLEHGAHVRAPSWPCERVDVRLRVALRAARSASASDMPCGT